MIVGLGVAALLVAAPVAGADPAPPGLWATVNICDTPAHPAAIGVLASIPRRARLAQWLRIRIEYRDVAAGKWRSLASGGDSGWRRVGRGRTRVRAGSTFTFQPPAAGRRLELRGRASIEWRRGRRALGRAELTTETGHVDPRDRRLADSRDSCVIAR